MKYPEYAEELSQLLEADQEEMQKMGLTFFHESNKTIIQASRAELKHYTAQRTTRMLQILDEIGEPSISNIGIEGAEAISVLALHSTPDVLKKVLMAFTSLYGRGPEDTYYQAIPPMTDRLLIREHKPQRFGTQWMSDKNKEPFLPPVEDFEHVNQRRAEYGIEPLRWPKSLAIPESEQPWLKRPLSELVTREPTEEELKDF